MELVASVGTRRSFVHANAAPRCEHVKLNGLRCGCPARGGSRLCHFHEDARLPGNFVIPLPEDAASIQLALVRLMRALQEKTYDTKTCALMLYALQIASGNLRRLEAELPKPIDEAGNAVAAEILRRLELTDEDAVSE